MNNSILYNSNGKECLYFRKYSDNDIQWWSFHKLSKQDIIDEISCYITLNDNPILVKSDYSYINKSDLFRKRKNTILKLIVDNNDFDNFHFIILKFRKFRVVLFKKGYEV